ncbi:MAG: nucleotidyltransferase family protein, partial [Acetatifactor sp.]|nr:nucleotidyltransferase family protein [Acetatifactor sp.]
MELSCFTKEETLLFELIAESLNQVIHKDRCVIEADFEKVLSLAGHQAVLPMIYPALKTLPLTAEQLAAANAACKYTAMEYYQIFFLARDIVHLFEEQGISVVLLKGVTAARFYPVAEARKSSDVDILLPERNQLKKAAQILEKAGYRRMDGQIANHHQVWGTPDNHVLELHTMIVE